MTHENIFERVYISIIIVIINSFFFLLSFISDLIAVVCSFLSILCFFLTCAYVYVCVHARVYSCVPIDQKVSLTLMCLLFFFFLHLFQFLFHFVVVVFSFLVIYFCYHKTNKVCILL